jgi:long-chain acyl-CoA synthetase
MNNLSKMLDQLNDAPKLIENCNINSNDIRHLVLKYKKLNIESGSVVIILAPNSAEFISHWIAIILAELVPCAIPPSSPISRISFIEQDISAAATIGYGINRRNYGTRNDLKIGRYDVVLHDRQLVRFSPYNIIILTTGTSGNQTACVHSLESIYWNANNTNKTLAIDSNDKQLITLPIFHTYGLITQLIGSIICGCKIYLDGPPFNLDRFFSTICDNNITVCGITPYIARLIISNNLKFRDHLKISIGGDVLFAPEVEKLINNANVRNLYITYGLTQAGPRVSVLSANCQPSHRYDSVGLPFDGIETLIYAPDSHGIGRLWVKTPSSCHSIISGGIGRSPLNEFGYLDTGDLFSKDQFGFLRFHGRVNDVYVVDGEKVNLRRLDNIIRKYPGISFSRCTVSDQGQIVSDIWLDRGIEYSSKPFETFLSKNLLLHERPKVIRIRGDEDFHK